MTKRPATRRHGFSIVAGMLACAAATAQGNTPPDQPRITEPTQPGLVLSPNDVHMETSPFSDPDPGDTHYASDWEIWRVSPPERVWHATDVTGFEKIHAHFGDGIFENSHTGWRRLFAFTQYTMRVRHRDSSGDPATSSSPWASIPFSTAAATAKEPLLLDDIEAFPPVTWTDDAGQPIELPTGTPNASMRIETSLGWLLLRLDGASGPGNHETNPPVLPRHQATRVVIEAGNTGGNLVLPASTVAGFEHECEGFRIHLPAIDIAAGSTTRFWVSKDGGTYRADLSPNTPDFRTPARSVAPPWSAIEPGYTVEVVAEGLRMPVNIAFKPSAGSGPLDVKYYVTELYGNIKAVTNDGTVLTYATGLVNYTPSGAFPGSGEQGLTGLAVDPATGDVFVSHLWRTGNQNYPRITRLTSQNGGRTSSSRSVILDMQGEPQGQSHQVSNVEIVGGQLYCHMGDGFDYRTAQNLASYRGKILRLNLDGSPVTSNPFYNGGTRDSRDYVFAYGVRNPFGGAWRAADNARYTVENGPSVDRFAKIVQGRNYGWNDTDQSMRQFALYNWDPARGPVNVAFVQPETFGGSGFPADKQGHAFVSESGPTYAQGQQERGKRITEFVLDAAGNLVAGPIPLVEYVGDGFATAVALAAGPDGLYFSEFYLDSNTSGPTDVGGRILRISYGDAQDCNANGAPDWCEIANGYVSDCNLNGLPDSCDIRAGTSTDFDANGVPDECDLLSANRDTLSVATGGRVDFTLDAGPANPALRYILVGSMSGTTPGTPLGGVVLPLNAAGDPWFAITSEAAGTPAFPNTIGTLDATGLGSAAIVLGPLPPSALGLTLHHAYVAVDLASFQFRLASNAVPLRLVP
ncbi:MAG: PQQ-dependent sugar dehydrogenase [Planctomycetota bacterium]|nr:PQQ-dependent sugar dehydrogenase [Planctomycetota bacterium]MDA1222104.1 PQQ-dependent sugar dehydrogenase [Planctomycetota bacterium]